MSTLLSGTKHPKGKKLSEALSDDDPRKKAQKGLIDKKATLVKAGIEKEADAGAAMKPSPTQLDKINEFTRQTVTADEVVTFPTLSCNDIVDRDDDQFSTKCVKGFAALDQPFSPIGKSYMLNHSRSVQDAVGRIYTAGTKKVSGSTFLVNDVYIPNTEQYQKLIEDINFGVAWAVSVGVVLGKDSCTVCGSPFSSWGWWCKEGHDKGLYYDPNSEEKDSWGWPKPTDASDPKAVKCIRVFDDPKDFYELSQVFLGAQYFAALDKEPEFASVMKSVMDGDVPILGLKSAEAEKLPLKHEPKKVSDARIEFGVHELEDGSLKWVDEQGLQWCYDPSNADAGVLSLGKAIDKSEEDEDGEEGNGSESGEDLGEVDGADESVVQQREAEGDEGGGSDPSAASGEQQGGEQGAEGSVEASADDEGSDDDSDEDESDADEDADSESDEDESDEDADEDEEKSVTTADVIAAARAAKLPQGVIERIESSKKDGVTSLALAVSLEIKSLQEKVSELEPKAALGDDYLKSLRADAIHFYTLSRKDPKELDKGVNTDSFQKVLDRVGDDVDLLKEIINEQKEAAQAKFPKSVRRSSIPGDVNEKPERLEGAETFDVVASENDQKVRRLHS